jgi:hypothetical protein
VDQNHGLRSRSHFDIVQLHTRFYFGHSVLKLTYVCHKFLPGSRSSFYRFL